MVKTLDYLKTLWITGYKPTQSDYVDLFDTLSNLALILQTNGSTGNNLMISSDTFSALSIQDSIAQLQYLTDHIISTVAANYDSSLNSYFVDGNGGQVKITDLLNWIAHSVLIKIDGPQINFAAQAGNGDNSLNIDNDGNMFIEKKCLRYKASVSQSGIAAPTVDKIFENTIGEIVWTYSGVGIYIGTLVGAFPDPSKVPLTQGFCSVGSNAGAYLCGCNDSDTVQIDTLDFITSNQLDGLLSSTLITIEIYQ